MPTKQLRPLLSWGWTYISLVYDLKRVPLHEPHNILTTMNLELAFSEEILKHPMYKLVKSWSFFVKFLSFFSASFKVIRMATTELLAQYTGSTKTPTSTRFLVLLWGCVTNFNLWIIQAWILPYYIRIYAIIHFSMKSWLIVAKHSISN